MTLPASGAISMSQVATELGIGTSGISLNLASVRTLAGRGSGAISMSDLRGKSNAPASALLLNGGNLYASGSSLGAATARANFNADGTYSLVGTGNGTTYGRWQTGSDGANYEAYWPGSTYGTMSGNWSQGTYASLEVQRYFSLSDMEVGGNEDDTNVTIRQKSNTANSTTFNVNLFASGQCFAFGTMLRTPTGDRLVETIMPDDLICSFTEPTMLDEGVDNWRSWSVANLDNVKTHSTAKVSTSRHFMENESVKINGIHSTLTHVHFVFDGNAFVWKEAGDVSGTDMFVDSMLNLVPITDIEHITEPTMFAAVNVDNLDTMQVKSGDIYILTHNVSA